MQIKSYENYLKIISVAAESNRRNLIEYVGPSRPRSDIVTSKSGFFATLQESDGKLTGICDVMPGDLGKNSSEIKAPSFKGKLHVVNIKQKNHW